MQEIAIVGSGPTAIYTLKHLVDRKIDSRITVFEAGDEAGRGMPYAPSQNSADMLANITSVEIPPVVDTLAEWLRSADDTVLAPHGLARDTISEREFYPRVLIGAFYSAQLGRLIERARAYGIEVSVRTRARVMDIVPLARAFRLVVDAEGRVERLQVDAVVMATGHSIQTKNAKTTKRLFRSPYPVRALELGADHSAVVLGSSLSGIDAIVALARKYGRFTGRGNKMVFTPRGNVALKLAMASRKGLLPEADFYYPIPEEPLEIFSANKVKSLVVQGKTGLLARAMTLFKRQLIQDDPDFATALGISRFTPESFGKAYFALRSERRGFGDIEANLKEARRNHRRKHIVMWRYTLMRAHEVFSTLVPYLDRKDLARFHSYMKAVFADAYGCVPHLSIDRLLALHRADCFKLVALGGKEGIRYEDGLFKLAADGDEFAYETMVDARGQQTMTLEDLGFHRLSKAATSADPFRRTVSEKTASQYRLAVEPGLCADIFCLSLPVLMKRYPFAQGLVSSNQFGLAVANSLLIETAAPQKIAALDISEQRTVTFA